jgi:hypothetical protein
MSMMDDKRRYHPRQLDEIDGPVVSLLNELAPPDNVSTIVRPKQRSLHAVLCEALTNTQALLARPESGVHVPGTSRGKLFGRSMSPREIR